MKNLKFFKQSMSVRGLKYFYIIFIIVFIVTTGLLFIFLKNNVYLSVYSDREFELLNKSISDDNELDKFNKLDQNIIKIERNFQEKIKIRSDNIKDIFNN